LGDGDPVQGAVELAIATAVESMATVLAGAGLERRDAGMAGQLSVAPEALDRTDLAEQLGGAQRAAAGKLEQLRSDALRACLQLAFELGDRTAEASAASDQLAGDRDLDRLLAAGEPTAEAVKPKRAVERAQRYPKRRIELVQVPAQPLLSAAPLRNEVVAVIDEQLQLPQPLLLGAWPVEARLAQRPPARSRARRSRLTCRVCGRPAAPARSASAAPALAPHRD
jgi:hypothetical protein